MLGLTSAFRAGEVVCGRYQVLQPFRVAWGEGCTVRDRTWSGATQTLVLAPIGRADAFLAHAAAWCDLEPDRHVLAGYYLREVEGRPALLVDHPPADRFDPRAPTRDQPTRLLLAAQLARALAHVHATVGVHGHLEPASCVMTEGDCLRLGRLHVAGDAVDMAWRAPERWSDDAGPTRSADVYALGVILHELFTGRRPFDVDAAVRQRWAELFQQTSGVAGFLGKLRGRRYQASFPPSLANALTARTLAPEFHEGLMRHFHTTVELPPADVAPETGLPKDLRELVVACLTKDPRRRPSAASVAGELEERIGSRIQPLHWVELTAARCNRVAALGEMGRGAEALAALDGWAAAQHPPDPLLWGARASVELGARPEGIVDVEARFDVEVRPFHPALDNVPPIARFFDQVGSRSIRVDAAVVSLGISPDGGAVAVAWAGSRRVCVWTLEAGSGASSRTVHVDAEEPAEHVAMLSSELLVVATRARLLVQSLDSAVASWFRAWREPVGALAVSVSGKAVIACGTELQVFDAATGKVARTLDVGGLASRVAIDATGGLVAALVDGALVELDLRDGSARRLELGFFPTALCFAGDLPLLADDDDLAMAVSPDGTVLAVADASGRLVVREVRGGAALSTLSPPVGPITSLAVTPDGATVVAGDASGAVRLWWARPRRWPPVTLPNVRERHPADGTISHSGLDRGRLLGDAARALGITVAPTSAQLDWGTSYRGRVTGLAFSRDGRRIAVAERHTVHLSQLRGGQLVHLDVQELDHDNDLRALVYGAQGTRLLAGTGQWRATREDGRRYGAARLAGLNQATGQAFALFAGETTMGRHPACELVLDDPSVSRRHCVILHADGRYVLRDLCSANGVTLNGARVAEALLRAGDVLGVGNYAFRLEMVDGPDVGMTETAPMAPDRQAQSLVDTNILKREDLEADMLAGEPVMVRSHAAVLWDCSSGSVLAAMHVHDGPVTAVALARDGQTLVSASEDGTVALWDAAGRLRRRFPEPAGPPFTSLALSPDDRVLAAGRADGRVLMWDLQDGSLVATLPAHRGSVLGVAFSGDGRRLASGGRDGTARLWLTRSREPIGVCEGHTGAVTAVAFSPDDRMLLTGSEDGTARLWSRWNGQSLHTLALRRGVGAIAFSPDGGLVVTGGEDGAVQAWSLRWLWAYANDVVSATEDFVDRPSQVTWLWPRATPGDPDLDLLLDIWRDLSLCGTNPEAPDALRERYTKVRTRLLYMVVDWLRTNGHAPRLALGGGGGGDAGAPEGGGVASPWLAIAQADPDLAAQARTRISGV